MEVWNDIDEKRRQRRLSRKERDRRKGYKKYIKEKENIKNT